LGENICLKMAKADASAKLKNIAAAHTQHFSTQPLPLRFGECSLSVCRVVTKAGSLVVRVATLLYTGKMVRLVVSLNHRD
jgi:hypothetical protein